MNQINKQFSQRFILESNTSLTEPFPTFPTAVTLCRAENNLQRSLRRLGSKCGRSKKGLQQILVEIASPYARSWLRKPEPCINWV